MATTNFKLFDENKANMLSDQEYAINTQRLNGVQTGIASSQLQNKSMYQASLMAYAIAQIMNQNGKDANDTAAVSAFVANLSGTMLQKVYDKASSDEAYEGISDTTWMSPALVKAAIGMLGTKVGDVIYTARDDVGNGFLLCDGRSLDEYRYPELAQLLGTTVDYKHLQYASALPSISNGKRTKVYFCNDGYFFFYNFHSYRDSSDIAVYYSEDGITWFSKVVLEYDSDVFFHNQNFLFDYVNGCAIFTTLTYVSHTRPGSLCFFYTNNVIENLTEVVVNSVSTYPAYGRTSFIDGKYVTPYISGEGTANRALHIITRTDIGGAIVDKNAATLDKGYSYISKVMKGGSNYFVIIQDANTKENRWFMSASVDAGYTALPGSFTAEVDVNEVFETSRNFYVFSGYKLYRFSGPNAVEAYNLAGSSNTAGFVFQDVIYQVLTAGTHSKLLVYNTTEKFWQGSETVDIATETSSIPSVYFANTGLGDEAEGLIAVAVEGFYLARYGKILPNIESNGKVKAYIRAKGYSKPI